MTNQVQSRFFDQIRESMLPSLSLVDELAEILSISRDSAYRRLRGDTVLSLDEAKKLADHFRISVDFVFNPDTTTASFSYHRVDNESFTFLDWLRMIYENLASLQRVPQAELLYFAKDLPVFYYFDSPLLSSFKMFFWINGVLGSPGYVNRPFSEEAVPREYIAMGKKIFQCYTSLRRTEIWSEETLNVTLRQIQFYHDCGFFANPDDAGKLCDEYDALIENMRSWAAAGYKEHPGSTFELYKNDLLIADNTILFRMGDKRAVFLPYNTLNVLSTTNPAFCRETEEYLRHLIGKSEKISTTGEKQRQSFFNHRQASIRAIKARLAAGQ